MWFRRRVAHPRWDRGFPSEVSILSNQPRLSNAQEEIRLRGLRLLARMIVRAYLKDRATADGPVGGATPPDVLPAPSLRADRRGR